MVNWSGIFTAFGKQGGATADELAKLQEDLRRPVDPDERDRVLALQTNPWPSGNEFHSKWKPLDPVAWRMPGAPLLARLSLVVQRRARHQWRDGVRVLWNERGPRVHPWYHLPEYMPFAVPLGLDGSGNFALFDVREPSHPVEYPVVVAATGNLGFDEARPLARDFVSFCRMTTRIERNLYP